MRRGVGLAVVAMLALAAAVVLAGPEPDHPVAVVGHTGAPEAVPPPTALPPPAPAPAATPATAKPGVVAATRSTTVVRSDAGGVTVVNSGSASASTGGNTVIGPPAAEVTEGPVTAIGNSSEVRVSSR